MSRIRRLDCHQGWHTILFHAVKLPLGVMVVLLLFRFVLIVQTTARTAFIAALLICRTLSQRMSTPA
jgi:hypothetical protein